MLHKLLVFDYNDIKILIKISYLNGHLKIRKVIEKKVWHKWGIFILIKKHLLRRPRHSPRKESSGHILSSPPPNRRKAKPQTITKQTTFFFYKIKRLYMRNY